MRSYSFYPPYVPVSKRKAKAAKKLKQLRKKNPNIKPVIISGRVLAKSWWGKSWNKNLEYYSDYYNRLGRGRSYVRHGHVLDLQVEKCKIKSKVSGSHSAPYIVDIRIKPISKFNWQKILNACGKKLDSLQELLSGKFPAFLKELLLEPGDGLFPSINEIEFTCSCPDGASMCKHVAATLYGVGARLDEEPIMIFTLREVEVSELVKKTLNDQTLQLLEKSEKRSSRVIDDSNLANLFGIDMEGNVHTDQAIVNKSFCNSKNVRKKQTILKTIVNIVKRYKNGVQIVKIAEKANLSQKQVQNAIFRAKKQKLIKSKKHGLYISNNRRKLKKLRRNQ